MIEIKNAVTQDDLSIEKVEPSLEASQLLAPNGNHHPAEYAASVLSWG